MLGKTKSTQLSLVLLGACLPSCSRRLASVARTATSRTRRSAARQETARQADLRRRYVALLISQMRYSDPTAPRFSHSATLHFKPRRAAQVSLSTEVRSSVTVIGTSSPPSTLQLHYGPLSISLQSERTLPRSPAYMEGELRAVGLCPPEPRSSEPGPNSTGSAER